LEFLTDLQCGPSELTAEVVERVVLLGAPISIKDQKWEAARKVTEDLSLKAFSLLFLGQYLF
jgi:hypothetical protein